MLKTFAYVFGVVFLVVGVLGFVPSVAPNGMLFGLFHVNLWHNVVHLVTGVVALGVGYCSCGGFTPKVFFQVFGVIYLVVALLGFWHGDTAILGVVANNFADAILHLVIAAVALYLGFVHKEVVA